MSRAWRKLNRKVQIDQRRYYLWMIAVLIGIPVNFIFSGWGEDELACTFTHFSSTWFMWVEYKTLSFSPPLHPHHLPLYREHIHACAPTRTHARGSKLLPELYLGWGSYVSVRTRTSCMVVCGWTAVREVLCLCMHVHVFFFFGACVCSYLCVWDSSQAISGNDSRETGECHYSDLFTF